MERTKFKRMSEFDKKYILFHKGKLHPRTMSEFLGAHHSTILKFLRKVDKSDVDKVMDYVDKNGFIEPSTIKKDLRIDVSEETILNNVMKRQYIKNENKNKNEIEINRNKHKVINEEYCDEVINEKYWDNENNEISYYNENNGLYYDYENSTRFDDKEKSELSYDN